MRLRWDLRRAEIAEIGLMAGWMFGYVASQWLGNLVVQRVANAAANTAFHHGGVTGVGYSAYSYAWQLFQLPYAIVGISVISALLPRMSGHATDRRYSLVRDDFSKGVRLASVIVVPAAVFLAVLGPPLCMLLFAWGSTTVANARYIGEVFGVFSLGLVAFMLTQLQLRVFYSFRENRTPAIIGMVMLIVGVIGALVALYALPADAHRDRPRGRLRPGDADRRDHRLAAAAAPGRQPGRLADHQVAGPDVPRHAARARVRLRDDGGRRVIHAPGPAVRPA